MTKIKRTVLTSLVLGLGLGFSGFAHADSAGAFGRVVNVRVNTNASDDFTRFRGEVTLGRRDPGTKKVVTDVYKWGGSQCSGKDLNADQIEQLHNAMTHRAHLVVRPYYKPGAGGAKCVVGFDVTAREAARNPPT